MATQNLSLFSMHRCLCFWLGGLCWVKTLWSILAFNIEPLPLTTLSFCKLNFFVNLMCILRFYSIGTKGTDPRCTKLVTQTHISVHRLNRDSTLWNAGTCSSVLHQKESGSSCQNWAPPARRIPNGLFSFPSPQLHAYEIPALGSLSTHETIIKFPQLSEW